MTEKTKLRKMWAWWMKRGDRQYLNVKTTRVSKWETQRDEFEVYVFTKKELRAYTLTVRAHSLEGFEKWWDRFIEEQER